MLRAAGKAAGLFGTVSYRAVGLPGRPAPLTTPGALMLHEILAEMRAVGTTDVVLEATSHALEQGRLDGCLFRVAALTNVTQDHLDYHGTMARYFDAKAMLFERLLDPRARDGGDLPGRRPRAARCAPARSRRRVLGVAARPAIPGADVVVERHTLAADGTRATLATPAGRIEIASPLVGEFNLSNLRAGGRHGGRARAAAPTRSPPGAARGRRCRAAGAGGQRARRALRRRLRAHPRRARARHRDDAPAGGAGPAPAGGVRLRRRSRSRQAAADGRDRGRAAPTWRSSPRDNPRTEEPDAIVAMILDGVRRAETSELDARALREARRGYHVAVDRRTAIQRAGGAAAGGRRAADRRQGARGLPDPRHDQDPLRRSRGGRGGAGGSGSATTHERADDATARRRGRAPWRGQLVQPGARGRHFAGGGHRQPRRGPGAALLRAAGRARRRVRRSRRRRRPRAPPGVVVAADRAVSPRAAATSRSSRSTIRGAPWAIWRGRYAPAFRGRVVARHRLERQDHHQGAVRRGAAAARPGAAHTGATSTPTWGCR